MAMGATQPALRLQLPQTWILRGQDWPRCEAVLPARLVMAGLVWNVRVAARDAGDGAVAGAAIRGDTRDGAAMRGAAGHG